MSWYTRTTVETEPLNSDLIENRHASGTSSQASLHYLTIEGRTQQSYLILRTATPPQTQERLANGNKIPKENQDKARGGLERKSRFVTTTRPGYVFSLKRCDFRQHQAYQAQQQGFFEDPRSSE
jgi:hypothetical protein